MTTATYDIVIAGAGLVGALTAIALAKQHPHWRIALIDPQDGTPYQDARGLALALRTQEILKQVGAWQGLDAATPIQTIHISDATGSGHAYMTAKQEGVERLGVVAQASDIQHSLSQVCQQLTNIDWLTSSRIQAIKSLADKQKLTVITQTAEKKQKQHVSCQLLVITDGSQSPTRELLGIRMQTQDYGQSALAGFIELEKDHGYTAYERFTPEGPFALLPYGPKRFTLIWCVHRDRVADYLQMSEADFLAAAQAMAGEHVGRFVASSRAGAFPLYLGFAERFIGHRTLILGNACHTLHPVAGQGYNLGVRDVVGLCQATRFQPDPGTTDVLLQYQMLRQKDYHYIKNFTHSLVHLFSNSHAGVSFARRTGLEAMRVFPILTKPLAQKAMGFGAMESLWR